MWNEYAPDMRMRLNLGIRRRLAPLLNNNHRLIKLAYSLLFTLPGTPIIYYGDEIGMGDNIWLPDRNGLRTPMQWDSSTSAGFSLGEKLYSPVIDTTSYGSKAVNVASQKADPASLWNSIHKMIVVRKSQSVLGDGETIWSDPGTNAVLAFYRTSSKGRILVMHNLSLSPQDVSVKLDNKQELTDLLSGQTFSALENLLHITLEPYQYLWLI